MRAQGETGMESNGSNTNGICIVAHYAYGALTGGQGGALGGVERQTSMLARWLAARGHAVSLLAWDEGQPAEVTIDGVRVIKMCNARQGLPGVRFFHPRWSSLNRALSRANAALYYQNCGEEVTGQVALWCRWHSRRFVFSSASNFDCDPRLPDLPQWRARALYRYGIRHADRLIVQTRTQQSMMQQAFGLRSTVLPMPCPGPGDHEYVPPTPPADGGGRVLWVGRITPVKRFERFLDVAKRLPEVIFEVAGTPDSDNDYSRGLLRRAEAMGNVKLRGRVVRELMPELYRRASLLCCTSSIEGFPNTFLEAWSYGVPLVTTFDPDGMVAQQGLGAAVDGVSGAVEAIRGLLASPARWRECSANARRYYALNHMADSAMRRFETAFLEVLGTRAKRAGGEPS